MINTSLHRSSNYNPYITNHHQHISIHTYTIKSSPIACKKIHQQHICTYTYIIYNNITTIIQQLHINSHNSSKGENTQNYDKHHIQHPLIIHTSSFIHIKLFVKDFQDNRTQ